MKTSILVSTAVLLLAGCAHTINHGTIAMKESDTVAHVSIHDTKPGEKIVLFRSVCEGIGGGRDGAGGGKTCKRQELAKGTVKNVLNEHYSLVEFPAGTKFSEGDFVETTTK